MTADQIKDIISAGLACDYITLEGDGRHWYAVIVSAEFEGLTRVRRHQRVYAALGDRMRAQVHALSMQTLTPAEYAAASPAAAQPPSAAGLHDH